MKLELKHLAPYLPYGLMCQLTDQSKIKVAKLCGAYTDNSYAFFDTVESEHGYSKIKPILRPLSDLTLIGEKGEHLFFPSHQLIKHLENNQDIFNCDYNEIDYLIRNHFDVFGLIEKGLAIDINKLK
jgi:hypothetical protein